MTPPAKWLPDSAAQFSSIQYFKDQIQSQVDKESAQQGKATAQVDLGQIQIVDQKQGDDQFLLVYRNEGLNLALEGLIQTDRHELSLWKYPLNGPQQARPLGYLEMKDTCSLTRTLTGGGDLKVGCKDGVVDPDLVDAAQKYPTLQVFDHYCRESYQKHLETNPNLQRTGNYDLKRTQVLNPEKGNFAFDLLYENPANAFYCRGHAQASGLHHFLMTSGDRREYAWNPGIQYSKEGFHGVPVEGSQEYLQVHEMIDGCRMTAAVVGEKEFHGQCVEWTEGERRGVQVTGYAAMGVQLAGLGIFTYDIAGGGAWLVDKVFKTAWHPASFGKWGSPSIWMSKKFWGGVTWSFKKGAQWIPAAYSAAKVGLATWNVTAVSAASAGSIGLAATVGFVGGLLVGTGLEKAQQWAFGNSISGLAGDLAFKSFGPADQSTIDWFDKWLGWLP